MIQIDNLNPDLDVRRRHRPAQGPKRGVPEPVLPLGATLVQNDRSKSCLYGKN